MPEKKREEGNCFEAEVFFDPRELSSDVQLLSGGKKYPASLEPFPADDPEGPFFVQVRCALPMDVHWKLSFDVFIKRRGRQGEGRVLFPSCGRYNEKQKKQRSHFLRQLGADTEDLIDAFARHEGLSGISGGKIAGFAREEEEHLLGICQRMEAEGRIIIVTFSPLLLYSKKHFEFLCEKVLTFLDRYHKKLPLALGISSSELAEKFKVHPRALSLALGILEKQGRIRNRENRISLENFSVQLSPEEEEILDALEKNYIQGRFQNIDLNEMRAKFRLSAGQLDRMIDLLVERKKIIQGPDGFTLHSRWLDDLVRSIRESGMREMRVSDFKAMTGLTRKYAIPLLELLDQIGITRRRGSIREIL